MKKINTLIVDDHQLVRDGLHSLLNTTSNINVVHEFGSGFEAIEYVNNHADEIDVILMDINMPEINGIDTTIEIIRKHRRMNILALSMYNEGSYIFSMVKAGAKGYVVKNSSRDTLIKAIETVAYGEQYFSAEISSTLAKSVVNKNKAKGLDLISGREIQVLKLIAIGLTSKQISKKLNLSIRTVETHRANIKKKLRLNSSAELIKFAIKNKLIK